MNEWAANRTSWGANRTTWGANRTTWADVVGICSVHMVIIECEVRVYKVAMVSTGMKVPMAVEAMEADKGWLNVPMAVETYGAVRIVPITVEAMEPNETSMKVPMAIQAM